jgi:hypothetical protein
MTVRIGIIETRTIMDLRSRFLNRKKSMVFKAKKREKKVSPVYRMTTQNSFVSRLGLSNSKPYANEASDEHRIPRMDSFPWVFELFLEIASARATEIAANIKRVIGVTYAMSAC